MVLTGQQYFIVYPVLKKPQAHMN